MLTVNDCAGIEYDDCFFECGGDPVYQALFNIGKVIIISDRTAVNSLGRKTAKCNYRSVGILCRLGDKLIGSFRLSNVHTCICCINYIVFFLTKIHCIDLVPDFFNLGACRNFFAFLFHIVLIIFNRRHIHTDLALRLLTGEAVIDIMRIGAENVAASSAALYVFNGCLAEKSDLLSSLQR